MTISRPIDKSPEWQNRAPEGPVAAALVNPAGIGSLIRQAAAGSATAFGELYRLYLDRIYRYLFYQVKDRMTAEDLTEEVFLKMWRALPYFRGDERAFTAWLYRIAHNHLIDGYRSKRQDVPLDDDCPLPDTSDSPEDSTTGLFVHCDLPRLLSCLPEQQKRVILLKFVEGLENDEIAAITGKSPGAIRITQMRALASLRRKLDEEAPSHA